MNASGSLNIRVRVLSQSFRRGKVAQQIFFRFTHTGRSLHQANEGTKHRDHLPRGQCIVGRGGETTQLPAVPQTWAAA
jgi:hypothetical protein